MSTRTPSQIGRGSNVKGKRFQAAVAKAIRTHFPQAVSGRDNGYRTAAFTARDTGDLARAGGELFWSLKDVERAASFPPGMILDWLSEATVKGGGLLPILVIKRKGHTDPLRSWCWLWLHDMAALLGVGGCGITDVPMMVELGHLLGVLAVAGCTDAVPDVVQAV